MRMKNKKLEIGVILILVANTIFVLYHYLQFPDVIPIHWNFEGQVDGYGGKNTMFIFAALPIAVYVLMPLLSKVDPKKMNYENFQKTFHVLRIVITLFMVILNVISIFAIESKLTGEEILNNLIQLVPVCVGVMFAFIGNYLPKIKQNYFIGIRTPWTLANEEVWHNTHRVAAPIWVVGGIVVALTGFIESSSIFIVLIIALAIMTLVPVIYSFRYYKSIK